MDLLPKSSQEFSSQKYWDVFFSKRKEDPFEWYGEYPQLAPLLHKYITPKDNLLIVGCGNSTLSVDLHTAGIRNQKSLDISSVVVHQMRTKYPHIDFVEGDVTRMDFPDNGFSCILDKGTFDALSPPPQRSQNRNRTEDVDEENEEKAKVDLMMDEIQRVLKPGGRFICISLLQPHVASRLVSYFHNLGWITRVVRCLDAEQKTAERAGEDNSVVFPVFMAVFTKLTAQIGSTPVIESSPLPNPTTFRRFPTLDLLLEFVKDQQNFAMLQRNLNQLGLCSEKGVELRLTNPITGEDRFILHVVDIPKLLKNPVANQYGIFVVPQGRETEWLFGTHEGRLAFALQTNFTRLVVVHLVRRQTYESMASVQEEIRDPLAQLAPLSVKLKKVKAPIMTIGNDVGTRNIVYQGHSDFSGDFVVEDVTSDDEIFRRLIFLNNPNVVQSEVQLRIVKKRGKEFRTPITTKLACQHHGLMTVSFGLLRHFYNEDVLASCPINSLLIGLGGGLLASFLLDFIPNLTLSVVEIDPEVVRVAKSLFGLPDQDQRLQVEVDDGLKFIQSTDSQYNIILIDVDNKSTKEGLSCPPPEFLDLNILEQFKKRLDPKGAILVLNLVCRNAELKKSHITDVQHLFPLVLYCDVPQEVNTLLFCFVSMPEGNLKNTASHIQAAVQLISKTSGSGDPAVRGQKHGSKSKSDVNKIPSDVDYMKELMTDDLINSFKILKV